MADPDKPKSRRPWGSGQEYTTARGQHVVKRRAPDGRLVTGTSLQSMAQARKRWKTNAKAPAPLGSSTSAETVGEYLARWLGDTAVGRIGPRTYRTYSMLIRDWIVPALGHIPIDELHADDVEGMVNGILDAGRSEQWAKHSHTVLRSALTDALRRGTVTRNVASQVSSVRVPRKPVTRLSAAQVNRFLDDHTDHPQYPIWLLAFTTGMRQGEILGLYWSNVDLERGTVTIAQTLVPVQPAPRADGRRGTRTRWLEVEPKTDQSRRTLRLIPAVVDALRDHLRRATSVKLVFARADGRGPLSPEHVTRTFKAMLAESGLPVVTFHAIRHTAAALMLDDSGGDLRLVSQVLGHSNIATTVDRYGGIAMQAMDRAADAMQRSIGTRKGGRRAGNGA